jgi:hypothetical protein
MGIFGGYFGSLKKDRTTQRKWLKRKPVARLCDLPATTQLAKRGTTPL